MFMFALRNGFVQVEIVSPSGAITLDGERFKLLDGVIGLGVADVENSTHALASGGSVHRHSRFVEGEMFLPLSLKGQSPAELYERRRELEAVILPSVGQVLEVRVTTVHTGAVRSRLARYAKGLNYTLGGQDSHFTWQKIGLTLSYVDPWWYGQPREVATRINALRKPLVIGEGFEPTRRNLFHNPGVEYGRRGFTSASTGPLSVSNDAFSGSSALKVDALGGFAIVGTPWTAVAAGSVLAAGVQVKVSPGVTHVRVNFAEDWGKWSATLGTEAFIPVSGAWTRITHTAPAASGRPVQVSFSLYREDAGRFDNPDPGEWAVFDEFILEEAHEIGGFFDGDTPDTQSVRHEWEGAPGQSPSVRVYTGEAPPTPFFPVVLSDSTIQGAHVLEVHGDAEVWPTWTINGPGEDLLIQNDVTGERIFISGEFGEQVTVVTRPQEQDVFSMSSDRGGLWDRVSLDSTLFPLHPGENRIRMSMVNAKPSSAVTLSYRERYRAGH